MESAKVEMRALEDRKADIAANTDRKIEKIEEGMRRELEAEKLKRGELSEAWLRKSDEKMVDVSVAMENLTSEKGGTAEEITDRVQRKLEHLEQAIIA